MCWVRWSNEAASTHADIWPDQPDVPANFTVMARFLVFRFQSACFRIQFLPDHIMIHSCLVWFPWWLRQGAMDPIEGTSFVGLMSPDLTFEFTHFNLVIRLSNVKQPAFPFCTFLWSPAAPAVPGETSELHPFSVKLCRTSETFVSTAASAFGNATWHVRKQATGMSFSCRSGLFGIWWGETCRASNSLEPVQPLHAIAAWLDHGPGSGNNRTNYES